MLIQNGYVYKFFVWQEKAWLQPKPRKDVFWQGYGVTPQSGLHRFLFSGGKPVFLRICLDFSHKAFDFVLCGNVNQSDSREVDVDLHIAMTA